MAAFALLCGEGLGLQTPMGIAALGIYFVKTEHSIQPLGMWVVHEPGSAPEEVILEMVILKGFSSLNDSVMYWQKGKGALGSPRDSVVFPQVQAQTQPELPGALEEIGFSEFRLVLMQFQIQTLML